MATLLRSARWAAGGDSRRRNRLRVHGRGDRLLAGFVPGLFQTRSDDRPAGARAGSPPTAAQLLLRAAESGHLGALDSFLKDWEQWSGELLESHLSFPVLGYYRSQHDNQSWLAALTTVLDCCTLIIAGFKDIDPYQAKLTFRHVAARLGRFGFGASIRATAGGRRTGCRPRRCSHCVRGWPRPAWFCAKGRRSIRRFPSCVACMSPSCMRWPSGSCSRPAVLLSTPGRR